MAISKYSNWLSENKIPKFDKGLPLLVKLAFNNLEIVHANGNKTPVQIKTNKFLVKISIVSE